MWNIQKWNKRTLEYAGAIFYSDSSMWSVTLQTSRETWERGRLRTKAECDRHAVLTGTTVNITSLTQLHTFHRECLCGTARTWNKAQERGRIWNRWLNLTSITTDSQYIYIYTDGYIIGSLMENVHWVCWLNKCRMFCATVQSHAMQAWATHVGHWCGCFSFTVRTYHKGKSLNR